FGLIVIALYALVLFTGDRSLSPKLGIDLQGGTRVTLVPQGEEPTQDQLSQATANRVVVVTEAEKPAGSSGSSGSSDSSGSSGSSDGSSQSAASGQRIN